MTRSRTGALLDDAVRSVEDDQRLDAVVDMVHEVSAGVARSSVGPYLRGRPLGHALHPLMTDVPIGCWTSAALLDLFAGSHGRVAARRLIGLGVLAALPTAMTGLAELGGVDPDDRRTARVATVHAGFNTVALLAYARSWSARRRDRQARGVMWSLFGAAAATAGGHLGGHLAFVRGAGDGVRTDEAPMGRGDAVALTDDSVVVGIDAAAETLGVAPSNVQVMIDEGLVEPIDGDPTTFRRVDLESVRLLGG